MESNEAIRSFDFAIFFFLVEDLKLEEVEII